MANGQRPALVIGVVSDLEDPDNLGRVKVTYPHLDDNESDWARLVSPMAGKERGLFLRPEVGDEVLVGFEQSDPRRPFVMGSVWSSEDKPPPDDNKAKENNWRFIRSRSGHIVKLDDTEGKERIEILDKDGERTIVLDAANKKIQVTSSVGSIEIKAPAGKITVESPEIEIKASTKLSLEGAMVSVKSTGMMDVNASGVMTIKGAMVKVN